MKLQMHAIHFNADKKLLSFIQKKLDKLETYYDRIIDGEVFLKVEAGDSNENKLVEIKLNVPGSVFFSKAKSKSFEAATDTVVEALRKQIRKYKQKHIDH